MSQAGEEWEYEYDQDATETFLLDLDLTSLNNSFKSNVPGRRPLDRPRPVHTGSERAPSTDARHEEPPVDDELDAMPSSSEKALDNPFAPASNSLQILDLHSHNPIVSYRNEIYSCTWADMIGTNMFFAPPLNKRPDSEDPVEMLGMSRVRLIGQKAITVASQDIATDATAGDQRIFRGTNMMPQHKNANSAMKRQADFLERLMDAKKARRDRDVVRVLVPGLSKVSTSATASPGTDDSVSHEELELLNRRVVRGDGKALVKLQRIYGYEDEPAQQGAQNEK